ncbi:hypothetical protein [Legionella clemsonensis]|uniref:Uncharacterized protein n=1 Tax=Legionella clemsonensis TaxID=1867846 RepID=A0A222P3Y8_9GAMM|nr:hypothetical protein [Legionella clemsonensis]ASQ46537.1 hypothetical protein clem_09940 [Legionella clemsonensis]
MNRDDKERMNQNQQGQGGRNMGQNPDERKQAPGQGGQKQGHKPGEGEKKDQPGQYQR